MRNEDDAPSGSTTSPAGDSYPARARWATHLIDQSYSAINSGIPVVGIVRVEDTDKTFEFSPGGGHWTELAQQRLAELNAPPWVRAVDYHLEMQVAAWMVKTDTRRVELVINREPCGERFVQGCHQALSAFLPAGFRLSVSGTRGGERYYHHDYDGKAR